MIEADFEGAKKLVAKQLKQLDKNLIYHGRTHTMEDVLPNAILLIQHTDLTPEEALIVKTAALFHDTGFLDQYDLNEPMGCERARRYLPQFGYTPEQISHICDCIMATQMPQSPKDLLAQLVCDADLGHLGSEVFFLRSEALRLELIKMGKMKYTTPYEWNKSNVPFLQKHRYFTDAAKKVFQPRKEQNERELIQLVNNHL
jgi:uncharacterized protein